MAVSPLGGHGAHKRDTEGHRGTQRDMGDTKGTLGDKGTRGTQKGHDILTGIFAKCKPPVDYL